MQVVVWGVILAYLVFAARLCRSEQEAETLENVDIVVTDYDRLQTISAGTVRGWLDGAGIPLEGSPMEALSVRQVNDTIASHVFVSDVKVWAEQRGVLHVEVAQRQPVMRVMTQDGYDFYVSHDMWILPVQAGRGEYVPVVTGNFRMPFERGWYGELAERAPDDEKITGENYAFLVKLINFVKFTGEDPFWNAAIVQFNVRETPGAPEWKEPEVQVIPRVGRHTVELGTLDRGEEKLAMLRHFYASVLDHEGWDLYSTVDVRYDNQVVCRK